MVAVLKYSGHPARLRVCYQKIAAPRRGRYYADRDPQQYCQLQAYAWCFDCDIYVCEIHEIARHSLHRTQVEKAA